MRRFIVLFLAFVFAEALSISNVIGAGDEEEFAKKWLKNASDTLELVEKTAKELLDGGIEEKAKKDEAIASEWDSAKKWLSMAKEELSKAKSLCEKKKWKECADSANWAWQLLVKTATAALNAGRAAGLK